MEHLETSKDEDAKTGHKTADTSFFGYKTHIAMTEERIITAATITSGEKTDGKELPDRTFEEAARLAAHYSKACEQGKAEIDYIQKKHIKKPNGSKPGFVVYYTNYSMTISTDITGIQEVTE